MSGTILDEVKTRLGVTGDYHDNTFDAYIDDVKAYLVNAGINPDSENAKGLIARGVADMWNYGSGDGALSSLFYDMCTQLALCQNGE